MATGGWYYSHQGHKFGPFSASQLKQLAARGQLLATDLVLRDGAERWHPASTVKGLFPETGVVAAPAVRPARRQAEPSRRPLWPWLAGAATLVAAAVVVIVVATRGKDGDGTPIASTPDKPALKKPDGEPKAKDPGLKLLPVERAEPKDKAPDTKQGPKDIPVEVKKDPVVEKKPDPEPDRRAAELRDLLKVGKAALEAKQYAAAEKAFLDAGKLAPDNEEAVAGLRAARDALALAETQDKTKKEQDQQRAAFRVLLESGLDNLMKQRYDAAIVALTEALKIEPKNAEAAAALRDAEEGRDAAGSTTTTSKEDQQKKIDAYRKLIDDGRLALFGTRQYDAAIMAFGQAQDLFPGDSTSAKFLQMAQQAKAGAAAALLGQPGMLTQAQKLVAAGRAAMAIPDFVSASQAFQTAAQMAPGDPMVVQALLDLQRALLAAQADADARRRILDAYLTLLKSGSDALGAQRFDDAIQAARAAVGLIPDDPRGQDLLQRSLQARDAALTAANLAQLAQAENARRAARIQQLLTDGRTALGAKQFKLAERLFHAARRLAPGDPNVVQALQDFTVAMQPPVDVERQKRLAAYQLAMKAGQDAVAAQRYGDAANAFTQAGQLVRTDQDPTLFATADAARQAAVTAFANLARQAEAQKRAARVAEHLAVGRAALNAKDLTAASQAFAKAQKLAPADPNVQQALRDLAQAQQAAAAVRFNLSVSPPFKLALNTVVQVRVTADRRAGYQGAITVELRGLPVGVTAGKATIPAGQTSALMTVQVALNAPLGASGGAYAVGSRPGGTDVTSPPFTLNLVRR